MTNLSRPRGRQGSGPHPDHGRPVLHDDARRHGRGRSEGRKAQWRATTRAAWDLRSSEGESAAFLGINRNKRSIVVDLRSNDGREIVLDMARRVRCARTELSARFAGTLGTGIRAGAGTQSIHGVLHHLRVRGDRPIRAARRVRPRNAGHERTDERYGVSRQSADQGGSARVRSERGYVRGLSAS